MNTRRGALAVLTLIVMAAFPAGLLAAEPDPSLRPVAITTPTGTIGALVAPVPVLVTNSGDTGGQIRVDNTSSLSEDISIHVTDYVVDANGRPVPAPADYPYGSSAWYRFEPASFTLPPGTSRDIRFALEVPSDAGAGDHFAALNVRVEASPGAAPSADGTAVRSIIVIQNRLQHRVAGARPEAPDLTLTSTTDLGGVHFAARIDNAGNTVLPYQADPLPDITLYNSSPWGDPTRPERTIPMKGFYVAPESTRLVSLDWSEAPIIGQYRAVITLPATDGLAAVVAETTFTVVNWPVLAMAVVALVLTLLGIALVGLRRRSPR